MRRGLLALLAGACWYTWGAPWANARLEVFREAPRGQRTLGELRALRTDDTLTPETRALVDEAEALALRERAWGLGVAALLSGEERSEALVRAASAPPLFAAPGMALEPEMPALVEALVTRYGPRTAAFAAPPLRDEWPMVDRRTRARALIALVDGPGLDPHRAAILLALTLDLLDAQARRVAVEEALARL